MNGSMQRLRWLSLALVATSSLHTSADDVDQKSSGATAATQDGSITLDQRRALGIVSGHAVATKIPERFEAFGLVLDGASLTSDVAEIAVLESADIATRSETARLQNLLGSGAGASPKMVEAAMVEGAKSAAQLKTAHARFRQTWGPMAAMVPAERQKLLVSVETGKTLLLRADLPGRHSLGTLPTGAQADIDGVQVSGRVLGLMQQTSDVQSVGVMVSLAGAPAGLGVGARVPVALMTTLRSGFMLPRDAVLYDELGAYVFEQHADKSAAGMTYFTRHNVKLLMPHANGWLVSGLDDDDDIVLEGAGALWSLEGGGGRVADSDADD